MSSVGRKLKTVAYAGLFGGVVTAFGGIMYTLYQELSDTSNGTFGIIERTVQKIEKNHGVMREFGGIQSDADISHGHLKFYGRSNNYGRRRPHIISRFLEDGTKCYDTTFFIEQSGSKKSAQAQAQTKEKVKGLVNLQLIQKAPGSPELIERYLSVDILNEDGSLKKKIILIKPPIFKWNWSYNNHNTGIWNWIWNSKRT